MIGCGLSSSTEKLLLAGLNSLPGTVARLISESLTLPVGSSPDPSSPKGSNFGLLNKSCRSWSVENVPNFYYFEGHFDKP